MDRSAIAFNALTVLTWCTFAFLAGMPLGLQGATNQALKQATGNLLLVLAITFLIGAAVACFLFFATGGDWKGSNALFHDMPLYGWLGGVLGLAYLFGQILLVPRIGLPAFMASAVTGQIAISLYITHNGLFSLPQKPVELPTLLAMGIAVMCIMFTVMYHNRSRITVEPLQVQEELQNGLPSTGTVLSR